MSIKVARAGTSGNMVKASVSADGYDVAEGMTDVSWDPQMFATAAGNDNDIVNLSVDASVSGATATRGDMGGAALAGWAIGVTHGEAAVEGAPAMLDGEGNASLETTVAKADLPATFSFAVADNQADSLDGGENYEADAVEHTHTGLMLAGTQDAGMIEVAYTTQTLKVYAHHEKDQVMGYTGNILGGDARDDGKVSVAIRYIDGSGRSRSFAAADSVGHKAKDGVHTFSNVPAGSNVIVQASDGQDKTADGYVAIKVLDSDGHSDELAAYTAPETNGITGGMFGEMGGSSHTVSLCPLQAVDPTNQDHGECASFAYVSTHNVSGQVWKKGVKTSGDDFEEEGEVLVKGIEVTLTPTEGKNLAGEKESFTTAEKDNSKTTLDERKEFSFDGVAAGVYTLGVPAGWRAMLGGSGSETAVANTFNPLGGNANLDVTPATATVYGRVDGSDGFPLDSVTVTINGKTDMTDASGRYIVEGISAVRKQVFITASRDGQVATKSDSTSVAFARELGEEARHRHDGRPVARHHQRHGPRLRHRRGDRRRRDPGGRQGAAERGHQGLQQGQARDARRRHLHGGDRREGRGHDRQGVGEAEGHDLPARRDPGARPRGVETPRTSTSPATRTPPSAARWSVRAASVRRAASRSRRRSRWTRPSWSWTPRA